MKKYRKQIYRITSLLCCIVLIVSLIAFPASASSVVGFKGNLVDYFSISTAESNYSIKTTSNSVIFDLPRIMYIRYVEAVIYSVQGFSGVSLQRGNDTTALSVVAIDANTYRVYGTLYGGFHSWDDQLKFIFNISGDAQVNFLSLKYSTVLTDSYPETGGLYVKPSSQTGYDVMSSPSSPVNVKFNNDPHYIGNFYGYAYISNWKKYDSFDMLLKVDSAGLSSLYVDHDNKIIPFSVTPFDSNPGNINYVEWDFDSVLQESLYYFQYGYNYQWILVHVDLSGIPKTSNITPTVIFTGNISANASSEGVGLQSCIGYVHNDNTNTLAYLFLDLKNYLSDLFGKDDPAAQQAQQTQSQINADVNTQISGAVLNWEGNIDSVTDGFNLGINGSKTALAWLGVLADRVFDGMGWFKNIYFTIALISVFLLLLSKSGISHGIGRIARRR